MLVNIKTKDGWPRSWRDVQSGPALENINENAPVAQYLDGFRNLPNNFQEDLGDAIVGIGASLRTAEAGAHITANIFRPIMNRMA